MKKYEAELRKRREAARCKAKQLGAHFKEYRSNVKLIECRFCRSDNCTEHSIRGRSIIDLDEDDNLVVWWLWLSAYICKSCNKHFIPGLPMVYGKHKYGYNLQAKAEELTKIMKLADVTKHFKDRYGIRIPFTTIHGWTQDEEARNTERSKGRSSVDKRGKRNAKKNTGK